MVAATPTPAHPGRVSSGRGVGTHTRVYWRADVVALIASDAELLEYVRYSSYGVATSYPKGDYDLDGDVDAADTTALGNFIAGSGGWNLDFNRDGNTDGDDTTEHASYRTGYTGGTGGRGVLSRSGLRNRMGYAGYQFDDTVSAYHVRHRVYFPEIGRWSRRDPAGYVDGMGLYGYVNSRPMHTTDPSGLVPPTCDAKELARLALAALETSVKLAPSAPYVKYPNGYHPENPYQHCVWNCRMARDRGTKWAEDMSLLKEQLDVDLCRLGRAIIRCNLWEQLPERGKSELIGFCDSAAQDSDWWDNQVGRLCGETVASAADCETCCTLKGIPWDTPEGPDSVDRPFGPCVLPKPYNPRGPDQWWERCDDPVQPEHPTPRKPRIWV